jgi:hypothetical protein
LLEWQYLQRTTICDPGLFIPLEAIISDQFILKLFQLPVGHPGLPPRMLTQLPIKFGGLALPNPVSTLTTNYDASPCALVTTLFSTSAAEPFGLAAHRKSLSDGHSTAHDIAHKSYQSALDFYIRVISQH